MTSETFRHESFKRRGSALIAVASDLDHDMDESVKVRSGQREIVAMMVIHV